MGAWLQGRAYPHTLHVLLLLSPPAKGISAAVSQPPPLLMHRLAVDYVARQEHLAEDLAALLGKLNARRDEGGSGGHHGRAAHVLVGLFAAVLRKLLLGALRDGGFHVRLLFNPPSACFLAPAGVPPLVLGKPLGTEKMREKCAHGGSVRAARHGTAPMQNGGGTWQGLVAKEQYCTAQEYYRGRHAHCRASIEAYFADDLQLLYGGGGG